MNQTLTRPLQVFKCILVAALVCLYLATISLRPSLIRAQGKAPHKQSNLKQVSEERFDMLVRDDFFAGMMGDDKRLDRGMKFCEEILNRNPKHAEALVWHGGGLLTRASRAYVNGDTELGDRLWHQGLVEMNNAVIIEPGNMGVKIGRAATLVGLAQSGWDAADAQSRALLMSALADYEKVYRWQRTYFHKLDDHSRGELLFGLASGWSILGEKQKTQAYLQLIIKECKGTEYEAEARKWLSGAPDAIVQHDCIGCHVGSSN
jgi:hypothetical protein